MYRLRGIYFRRENAILKKAVRLQHRLDREKAAANRELQERVRSLEADKYTLSVHLKRARPQGPGGIQERAVPPGGFQERERVFFFQARRAS